MNVCNCEKTVIHKDIVEEVKNKMLIEEELIDLADFFKIFGDCTRLKIINALLNSRMCVSDIAVTLDMSHSAVSHQLRVLKSYKIVRYEKHGKVVYYELDDNHIKEIFDKGCEHLND